jgi:peptidoglycan-N-acetylglucosamine deacetylase
MFKGKKLFLIFILSLNIVTSYNPDKMPTVFRTNKKEVALTLDDGPTYLYTENILDILKKYNVKASFFLIGNRMREHPEMVKRIYLEGHDIGNHTYNHLRLDRFEPNKIEEEIIETNKMYINILGFLPKYFRPPGGRFNNIVYNTIKENKLFSVGWSINTGDFLYINQEVNEEYIQRRVARIISLLEKTLKPGSIILMHNGSLISVQALPEVIKYIQSQGYTFVKLSEVEEFLL